MRSLAMILAMAISIAACASTSGTTTLATTTTTSQPETTTTGPVTTTSTLPTTTMVPAPTLPGDACERLDVAAMQSILGVDSLRAGSPFGTSSDGASATCRFAVTYNGNFGSAFNVVIRPPIEGAYDDLVSGLAVGDATEFPGLGTRATLFETESGSRLLVAEFANLAAAYAVADNDDVYAGAPEEALAEILGDVVGSVLLTLP